MSGIKLGPWPAGLDNVSDPVRRINGQTRTLESLADAVDVVIDRDGWAQTRPGRTLLAADPLHSLWRSADGITYGGRGAELVRVQYPGTITSLYTCPSGGPFGFADTPSGVVWTAGQFLGEIREGTPRQLGVTDGSAFTATAIAAGGLDAGTYAVAVAYVDQWGREGGLSALQFLQVAPGGGIRLTAATWPDEAVEARVYRTKAYGDVLYSAASVPWGTADYMIGAGNVGRLPLTQHLRRMVGGRHVAHWRGRLLVAGTHTLRWSEPMGMHLYSPRHNWLQFPHTIRFLAPVEGGVWVGHARGVDWLAGTRPGEWTRTATSAAPPMAHSAVIVPASELPIDLAPGNSDAAVWMSERGFSIGTADGRLIEVQAKRVQAAGSGVCALHHNRRLTAFTQ